LHLMLNTIQRLNTPHLFTYAYIEPSIWIPYIEPSIWIPSQTQIWDRVPCLKRNLKASWKFIISSSIQELKNQNLYARRQLGEALKL